MALNEKIHMMGTFFMQGTQRAVHVKKELLPEHLKYVYGISSSLIVGATICTNFFHRFALDGDNIAVTGLFSDNHNDLVCNRCSLHSIYFSSSSGSGGSV